MMIIRNILKAAALLSLLASTACRFPYTRPAIPYQEVYEEIARIPPGYLDGRLFILDPGHGGSYTGAVTPDSLRECDINLAVGRHLCRMLETAGARVIMTRYTDADFIRPGEKRRLGTDLAARCDISNRHDADLFISLHHNASAFRHPKYNATETFVKMTDDRQSMDAARPIHRRLATILSTGSDQIIPGNFHVLRHNRNPAILGEAAYMTNKRFARLLRDPAFLELEAAAYFLGITDYVGRGIPAISRPVPCDTTVTGTLPEVSARITGTYGIDPASVEMRINGTPVDHTFDPVTGRAAWTPRGFILNGRYDVAIDARNVNGNAARTARARFTVDRPPAHLLLRTAPASGAGIGEPVTVEAMLFDTEWTPVIDGTMVTFTADRGHLRFGQGLTTDGKARTYCSAAAVDTVTVAARCGSLAVAQNIILKRPATPVLSGFVTDAASGRAVPRAALRSGGRTAITGTDGYAALPADTADAVLGISRAGYVPADVPLPLPADTISIFPLKRMFGGMLFGRRIVIDPEFGGNESGATGYGGTRAADVNLRVARYLKQYLLQAGADAVMTRSGDRTTTGAERVLTEAEEITSLFVTIRHGSRSKKGSYLYAAHHYQSGNGKRAAAAIARELSLQTGTPDAGLRADYGYAVMQTGCPAVVVNPAFISDPETERQLARPAANRRTAYGIFCGILRYYGVAERYPGQLQGVARTAAGIPLTGALITLDGHTVLQTGDDGRYRFRMLGRGLHTVTVAHGGRIVEKRTVRVR